MTETKKLIPGETQIGTVISKDNNGMIRDFSIYYGNVASPIIDGNILHMKEDRYLDMLKTFLESDTGREYEIPAEEEVKQATIEMLNRETRLKRQKEQKEFEKTYNNPGNIPEPMQDVFDNNEEVKGDRDPNVFTERTQQLDIAETELKTLKKNTESETYPEGKENEKTIVSGIPTEKGKDISLYNVLLIMLLLFSLLGNVFQWMLSTGYIQINPGDTTERNTGMAVYNEVIENTVTIPLDESEMEEGETKIKIYGVTVKEENGKIKSSAMSLGEYRIAE